MELFDFVFKCQILCNVAFSLFKFLDNNRSQELLMEELISLIFDSNRSLAEPDFGFSRLKIALLLPRDEKFKHI